jgi:hypothetical protein
MCEDTAAESQKDSCAGLDLPFLIAGTNILLPLLKDACPLVSCATCGYEMSLLCRFVELKKKPDCPLPIENIVAKFKTLASKTKLTTVERARPREILYERNTTSGFPALAVCPNPWNLGNW